MGNFPTLNIGALKLAPALVLAPMSGITNSAFRRLIKRENPGSVGLVVTEFISIEALTRQNERSLKMLSFCPSERPISIQIFGHDIARMVEAAQMVEGVGADIVDINCGCPVPKVVKRGGGCELMRQPEHLQRLLAAVKRAVSIPLTLKIRAGWDAHNRNALEIARIAQGEGVQMLAIHGRTRAELYRGCADWQLVAEVSAALKIPVVGSGDVADPAACKSVFASGVAGVMIGRGALANPWIFREIAENSQAQDRAQARMQGSRPLSEIPRVIRDYAQLLREEFTDKATLGRLKAFASQVTRSVPGSAEVRRNLCTSLSLESFLETLLFWEDNLNSTRRPVFENVITC